MNLFLILLEIVVNVFLSENRGFIFLKLGDIDLVYVLDM